MPRPKKNANVNRQPLPVKKTGKNGVKSAPAKMGPVNPLKAKMAKKIENMALASSGAMKTAGMMLNSSPISSGGYSSNNLSAYYTSYANGMNDFGGTRDIPPYFVMMNEQNGGLLYWPVTLREKYEFYRYFTRTDAYCGRGIELLTDLPMSRLSLNMPKMEGETEELKKEVKSFYESMCDKLNLFDKLRSALSEYNIIGNCFPAGHMVHTIDGFMPIEQIRKGDKVLTSKGSFESVTALSRRGIKERLVKLEIARLSGNEFASTEEHPIFVKRKNWTGFVKASEVRVGDYVGIAKRNITKDVDQISLFEEYKNGLLNGKYDSLEVSSDNNSNLVVNITHKMRSGSSLKNVEIKDILLSWLGQLTEPVIFNCEDLAKKLDIPCHVRLRTAAYALRRKGLVKTERVGVGGKGSAIRWFPTAISSVPNEVFGTVFKKTFAPQIDQLKIDSDFLYVLGYWLGDGWLWKNKRPASFEHRAFDICIQKNTPNIEKVLNLCQKIFGSENVKHGNSPFFEYEHLYHVYIDDVLFCEWWSLNFGSECKNKRIPSWIKDLPPEKSIWILKGMIDSDGCISTTKSGVLASICNTNKRLIDDLFEISMKSGIPLCLHKSKENVISKIESSGKSYKSIMYSLTSSEDVLVEKLTKGCVKEIEFSFGKEKENHYPNYIEENGEFYFRVENISEPYFEGYVYNFEVENEHTYCVNHVKTHNCYIFAEWNTENKSWEKLCILPPEEVRIFYIPFSDHARIEYRPERLIQMVKSGSINVGSSIGTTEGDVVDETLASVPQDVKDMINDRDCIIMDTDPTSGSFCYHLARNRAPYEDLGVSVLERVFVPMLTKEHYRYTQLSLASRNMTPKNKIQAPGLLPDDLTDLRAQVDLSYLDPEFSIVTNYEWDWTQIGAEGRLLDLAAENEAIENQIFAGLGVTRELLTGEGMYSGTKITVEILNTLFLLTREILQNYVEKHLFRPVAEAHNWYKQDKNGTKEYFYPKLRFNRLSLRDNQEVFDSMFQLYQKGSLPIDVIYELLNLNADDIHDKIYSDLFTVKDSVFNRVMEEASSETGRALAEKTNLVKRIAKYLRLDEVDEQGNDVIDPRTDQQRLTPDELAQKQRAQKKEKHNLEVPEMSEFTPQDVDDIAQSIAQGIDVNQNQDVIRDTVNQTVDEVLGDEKQK